MTRRTKKILLITGGSIAGVIVVLIIAAILVLQSGWFANFAKSKIIALAEQSTGGVVQIGSFQFDLWHLTVRIRDFVLHGTEPKTADPLVRVRLLEARVKLFSGFKHMVDLQYLGIEKPEVDLIMFPNGKTNIPQPKNPTKSSGNNSTLETIVNLAVKNFRLDNGLLQFADEKASFNARGENLRVLFNYDFSNPRYDGSVAMDPLLFTSDHKPSLNAHVNIPIVIEKDAVRVSNATVTTPQSRIALTAALEHMNAPIVSANLNARVSLPEIQRSLNVPFDANAAGAPKILTADLTAQMNEQNKIVRIQTARVALGQTTLAASGALNPGTNSAVHFNADLALNQLARLMKVSSMRVNGALLANGTARLDAKQNYSINGDLDSHGLGIRSGTTQVSDIRLRSPFHADPYLISLDGLRLTALGGDMRAKIFVENMQRASLEANLRSFSLPVLAAVFTGKHLGYDSTIDGSLNAKADLKAKGTSGDNAQAMLRFVPGSRGVPLSGRIDATFAGASGRIDLGNSYLELPNTRLDLAGSLNHRIGINLVSHNLNDFLPAMNFGSSKPQSSLPVSLRGGAATMEAQITGNLSAPNIAGRLAMDRFAIHDHPFDQFSMHLAASPRGASVENGVLTGKGLQTNFDASIGLRKWKPTPLSPFTANLDLHQGDLADLLSLAGESSIPASGQLTAAVHINGTYGNPLGNATLQVLNGSAYQQAFSRLYAGVNLGDQLITISNLELDTAGGKATLNGTFRHSRDSFTQGHAQVQIAVSNIQLADVRPLQERSPGSAGAIQLTANAAADLQSSGQKTEFVLDSIVADLSATGLRVQNQSAGDMTATVRTQNRDVHYNVVSDFAGSNVHVTGRTSLAKGYNTTADASIQKLSIAKVLQITGQTAYPVSGELSANAHVTGTLQSPAADLSFTLAKADVYQEHIDRLQGGLSYVNTLVRIPSIKLDAPAGSLTLTGSFSHPANNFKQGALNLKISSTPIQLAKIYHLEQAKPGLAGTAHITANLSANVRQHNGTPQVLISNLDADAGTNGLSIDNQNLGGASFLARTSGQHLNFRLDSDLFQSRIHASGVSQLTPDYPTRADLSFANIRYSNIAPFIATESGTTAPLFDALVEGKASVNGPLMNAEALNGRLELTRLDIRTNPHTSPTGGPANRTVDLQNQGPIVVALSHSAVNVQQFRITGPGTNITAGGAINLKNGSNPLGLTLDASLDLGVLQDIDRDFYSSGAVSMNTVVHGSFAHPLVNGQVVLKNANINYTQAPNGLSNANGVILLNGTNATIQTLTAESGGGKISIAGFVGFGGPVLNYNLRANANKVRVRYSGVSVTSNANIRLIGSSRRSLLGGTVTIQRVAYNSSSDMGSLLSSASAPPSSPTAPSGTLAGMRLDIRILTAPNLHVASTYTNRLEIFADITVRGTAANPGMVGRLHITNGQLVFFGNTYTVNTGTINFYNPTSIQPVLDISLETITQGVDVVIGVSGTMDDLRLSYRSDPPLSFEQIVQLLATNTTPSNPVIAAHQPTPPQQSLSQMGESAILGQAIANPVASRLQRVFGLTQFKIDPSFAGSNGQPSARVTLQQKIASNITFTYITDVTETNNEIVRVEWDFTSKFSAVALRDFNGNVSLEFFYKFKKR